MERIRILMILLVSLARNVSPMGIAQSQQAPNSMVVYPHLTTGLQQQQQQPQQQQQQPDNFIVPDFLEMFIAKMKLQSAASTSTSQQMSNAVPTSATDVKTLGQIVQPATSNQFSTNTMGPPNGGTGIPNTAGRPMGPTMWGQPPVNPMGPPPPGMINNAMPMANAAMGAMTGQPPMMPMGQNNVGFGRFPPINMQNGMQMGNYPHRVMNMPMAAQNGLGPPMGGPTNHMHGPTMHMGPGSNGNPVAFQNGGNRYGPPNFQQPFGPNQWTPSQHPVTQSASGPGGPFSHAHPVPNSMPPHMQPMQRPFQPPGNQLRQPAPLGPLPQQPWGQPWAPQSSQFPPWGFRPPGGPQHLQPPQSVPQQPPQPQQPQQQLPQPQQSSPQQPGQPISKLPRDTKPTSRPVVLDEAVAARLGEISQLDINVIVNKAVTHYLDNILAAVKPA